MEDPEIQADRHSAAIRILESEQDLADDLLTAAGVNAERSCDTSLRPAEEARAHAQAALALTQAYVTLSCKGEGRRR